MSKIKELVIELAEAQAIAEEKQRELDYINNNTK